jgi:acyltransferase
MTRMPARNLTDARIPWVDVAKALGIVLVFHGHFVQWFIPLGVEAAAAQMKWIYAFHMPMFFMLVGFVYKDRAIPFDAFIKRQLRTRLVPAWIFNIVGMFAWIATQYARGANGWVQQQGWGALFRHCATETLALLYQGRARVEWNIVTWFLICLFTIELWQYGLRPLLRSTRRLVISMLCFAALAVLVNIYSDPIHVLFPQRHWWYISAGLTAMVFYQLGMLLRRLGLLTDGGVSPTRVIFAAACFLVTLGTYELNRAADANEFGVVLMVAARFGNLGWFLVTALAGSFFIVFLSQLVAGSRLLQYVGRITLTLLCLDGILLEFVNRPLADVMVARGLTDSTWGFTILGLLCTVLSLAICLPANWLLERYAPWTIGGRKQRAVPSVQVETPPVSAA